MTAPRATTPARDQRLRRMPAEWEPHVATWLGWPHNPDTWPGCLSEAEAEFQTLVETLAQSEPVELLVQSSEHERYVSSRLLELVTAQRVRLHVVETDDVWLRDIAPTFVHVEGSGSVAIDWTFNAWGGKYPPWDRDDAVAARIADLAGVPRLRPELVCEGGALEVDGEGTLLATEATLLDPKRNPGVERGEIERELGALLGVRHVVWLGEGIEGDDTDGHIDDVARFVAPGRVLCAREPSRASANHEPLEACHARLREARDAADRRLEVIDLPMPRRMLAEGEPLPASYANFYVANKQVLVPTFGDPADESALELFVRLFPGRGVVGIPSRSLIRGLGAVHCLSQQQPVARWP